METPFRLRESDRPNAVVPVANGRPGFGWSLRSIRMNESRQTYLFDNTCLRLSGEKVEVPFENVIASAVSGAVQARPRRQMVCFQTNIGPIIWPATNPSAKIQQIKPNRIALIIRLKH